jgi:hypothetical protein
MPYLKQKLETWKRTENITRTSKQQRDKRRRVHYIQMAVTHAAPYEKHGQTAWIASEEEARSTRARREKIIEDIKRMRGFYG